MELIEKIILMSFAVLSCIESYFDGYKTKLGKEIEHSLSAGVRVVTAVVTSIILFYQWYYMFTFTIIMLLVYWIPFDVVFNIAAERDTWRMGKTAELDKIAQKITGGDLQLWTVSKVTLLCFMIFIHTELDMILYYLDLLWNYFQSFSM